MDTKLIDNGLINLKSDLDASIENILELETSLEACKILKSDLKYWSGEYSRVSQGDKKLMKTVVLIESISCMRAILVSLSKIDEDNSQIYKKSLDYVQEMLTLLREKEVIKINAITEILHYR